VPLGNPGEKYADTRHNLGRLLLQRWMSRHCPNPGAIHRFRTGTLYRLKEPLLALVPGTYMNLSGQVVGEALKAGFEPTRMILLFDDKDLPLGKGRFRLEGSSGGHNGVQSVIEHAGSESLARLRLGIGPFIRPLHQFVLQEWSPEEWARIEALDGPFDRFMERLAGSEELGRLPGLVNGADFWD
jgi:PTH1 family peptidyl-tRNA hydrolase